jgi:DNA-directed RNA polymerase subunit beta
MRKKMAAMTTSKDVSSDMRQRTFSRISSALEMPNLLDIQVKSFEAFLQHELQSERRADQGLQAVFKSVFPIEDVHNRFSLEFVGYSLGKPKYSVRECQERGMTYSVPLKATLRLIVRNLEGQEERIKDIIEQRVFLGEMPMMTETGTFIINGAERVVVSQLHRSPGVFFDETGRTEGKRQLSARVIPYRGPWIEFSLDANDVLHVHIDKKRKVPVTVLLRAMGYSTNKNILDLFFEMEKIDVKKTRRDLSDSILAADVVDEETGEILLTMGEELSKERVDEFRQHQVKHITIFKGNVAKDVTVFKNTIHKDFSDSEEDALFKLYALLRPGEPPNIETARALLEKLLFNPKRYDLGEVGRHRINERLNLPVSHNEMVLMKVDFIAIIQYLLTLRRGEGYTDDIDHLGNRRARTVGELLAQQFSVGLSRMARTARERMSLRGFETVTPQDLVNARTVSAVINAFFGSSQLSQFMDQTNPLAELTHKRRLSALGPGGLTRERAGFEVRDVHHTHYGRMCPIETPEGPNIGLITSLSTYGRVNEFGFIETPYRKVEKGRVTDAIEYLTADQEDKFSIAQANEIVDEKGQFVSDMIKARRRGDVIVIPPTELDYMDVSAKQLVSVAAALIPFLEHDDANRALMGSNMQRQAVPLLKSEVPLVQTGVEGKAALDSGTIIVAKKPGRVVQVSADKILVQRDQRGSDDLVPLVPNVDEYDLVKFKRSNQDTCIHQKPLVQVGDRVHKGDILADGSATHQGRLSLGKNVLVAFMPWSGYNFEDAIVVSERLVQEDVFTSIHVEEFELQVRDTKRGTEEITREIPNVSETAVRNLNEQGIVRVGAEVTSGDILVGKVTPKGETELSPEERLLRAIFGEKAGDVRDASLKAPPGMRGVVIDTKLFSRRNHDAKTREKEKKNIQALKREAQKKIREIKLARDEKIKEALSGVPSLGLRHVTQGHIVMRKGTKYSPQLMDQLDLDSVKPVDDWTQNETLNKRVGKILQMAEELIESVQEELEIAIDKVSRGDELLPGIVQLVKVYVAKKQKLSVGDKMAGRHGNKGVIAKIVPMEDMPYLPDGTSIDIVLNPLGVPSRMNVGQILETHLGWAAKALGLEMVTPIFDGATQDEIKAALSEANLPTSGKAVVFDGRTGEPFDREVTVGHIYMMKLHHLVEDKIHARSIGPYSLVTQQPLGGKAQFGGQRFGEMEVWALEAYGAAHALQEMLTVKSDDVAGRSRIYEAIVKGENPPEPGIPESFNVLVKELQSLGLDVQLEEG